MAFRIVLFLFLAIALTTVPTFADMGPKSDNSAEFKILRNGKDAFIDSIAVITYRNSSMLSTDTVWLERKRRGGPYSWLRILSNSKNYFVSSHLSIDGFKIIAFIDSIRFESKQISTLGDRRYFIFDIQDNGGFKDSSPLFYRHWSEYFKALFLTIVIEALITLLFWVVIRKNAVLFLLIQLLCNLLTHPILWYVESHFLADVLLSEAIIIVIESTILAIAFRKKIPIWASILIAVIANSLSWFMGGILMFMTG